MSESSAKPSLLVLSSTYPRWPGDTEPGFVHELSRRLTTNFDVTVLAPHAQGSSRREILDGVSIVRFRYFLSSMETLVNEGGIISNLRQHPWKFILIPFFLAGLWLAIRRLIRSQQIDVIHAHWLIPQGIAASWQPGSSSGRIPFLVTSHGADLFALKGKGVAMLQRVVINKAAAVTVVSHTMLERLSKIGADTSKVRVVSMGVDLTGMFTPSAEFERSTTEILFVGRLVEKKGLRHLIDALPTILKQHPHVHLKIIGSGPDQEQLTDRVTKLGLTSKVIFIGALRNDELPYHYRQAAVFAAPFVVADSGDQEGLGLVLVEAMGCGCPIVTTTVPAVNDLVHNEETGLIVPMGDAPALAVAICRILNDRSMAVLLGKRAREFAVRHYDWRVKAETYTGILKSIKRSHSYVRIVNRED
ncbi:MAG: glycosyltransferase family 4 protein [Ferrovum sp.]|nr:glycosyltransferase family 4 protein [Ferrovum sp.]